jgi:hypothetical protein
MRTQLALGALLLLAPIAGADPYLFLQDRGEPSGGFIPPGAHTYDLTVDTQGLDWARTGMIIDVQSGELWQHPLGMDRAQPWSPEGEFLDVYWDTYVTAPGSYPNTLDGYGDVIFGSFEDGWLLWGDIPLDYDGPYVLARLTVTEDFVGRVYGVACFSETGYEDYPYSLWIPEPGTLAGLIALAALAARRGRVALAPCGQRGS